MVDKYKNYLLENGKAYNTINSYALHIEEYFKWYKQTYGAKFEKLYRANILDYVSFLRNIKKTSAKTVNAKLSALMSFNEFLIACKIQDDIVINKKDFIKVQNQYASPSIVNKQDVEAFRQKILVNQGKRDYAIVTILAYAGLRISELLNLNIDDVDLIGRQITITNGKGKKQRIVFINDAISHAVKEYLQERNSNSKYLFVSRQGENINRTRINQIFNKYSDNITPHTLRHFFCSRSIECGYSIHQVANLAGHSNIHTTLLYTNPSIEEMKEKANLL